MTKQAVSEKAKRGTGQRVKSPLWLYLIGFPLTSSLELLTRMAYLELLVRMDSVNWHGLTYTQASEYTDSQAKIFLLLQSLFTIFKDFHGLLPAPTSWRWFHQTATYKDLDIFIPSSRTMTFNSHLKTFTYFYKQWGGYSKHAGLKSLCSVVPIDLPWIS